MKTIYKSPLICYGILAFGEVNLAQMVNIIKCVLYFLIAFIYVKKNIYKRIYKKEYIKEYIKKNI